MPIKLIKELRPDFDTLSLRTITESMEGEPFERKCLVSIAWGIGYVAGYKDATSQSKSVKKGKT